MTYRLLVPEELPFVFLVDYPECGVYGAPFVTSRILLTEYNSVQQNTNYVGQNYILSTECNSVGQNTNSVGQNCILLDRITFCWTELYSVGQNYILST